MIRGGAAALLCVCLCACADLGRIESEVCGNSVVEAGEDCDGAIDPALGENLVCGASDDGPVRACRYTCTNDASCPAGTACSAVGVCRVGSGTFVRSSAFSFRGNQLELRDMDGDGALDAVAAHSTGVSVVFGDGEGAFEDPIAISTPQHRGTAAFSNLASANQVAFPIAHSTHTVKVTKSRSFEAVMNGSRLPDRVATEFQSFDIDGYQQGRSPVTQAMFMQHEGTSFVIGQVLQNATAQTFVLDDAPTGAPFPPDTAELATPDPGTSEEFLLAFKGDDDVRVLTIVGIDSAPRATVVAVISVDGLGTVEAAPLFANANADQILDVVIPIRDGSGGPRVVVAPGLVGGRSFGPPEVDTRFDYIDQGSTPNTPECLLLPPAARAGYPLAARDFDGDGVHDFVTEWGVHIQRPGDLLRTHCFARRLVFAETGDLNRDGFPDIGAIATEADGTPHIMRALGLGNGIFTAEFVDTSGQPKEMRIGDFDGDLVHDIAIIERLPDDVDAVSISFGDVDGAAQPFATLTRSAEIRNLNRGTAGLPADFIDELGFNMWPTGGDDGHTVIAIGARGRHMVEGFSLLAASGLSHYLAEAVLLGDFDGDEVVDSVTLTSLLPSDFSSFRPGLVWFSPGRDDGTYAHPYREDATQITGIDGECMPWAVGDVDGSGGMEAVALTLDSCSILPGQRVSALILAVDSGATPARFGSRSYPLQLTGEVIELRLVDFDHDGLDDLLVSLRDRVVVLWNNNGIFDGTPALVAVGTVDGVAPRAGVLQADIDLAPEIVVADGTQVQLFDATEDREFAPLDVIASVSLVADAQVRGGDVNRDGADDFVVSTGTGLVEVFLGVPRAGIR